MKIDKSIVIAVANAALIKLNNIRRAVPGIGGDSDANNLVFLTEDYEADDNPSATLRQAARTLEKLAQRVPLCSDCDNEVAALRAVANELMGERSRAVLEKAVDRSIDRLLKRPLPCLPRTVCVPGPHGGDIYEEPRKPETPGSGLAARVARIEERENALAELFRELSVVDIEYKHARSDEQTKRRELAASYAFHGVCCPSRAFFFARGLAPYRKRCAEIATRGRELNAKIRAIRETKLS